MKLKLYLFYMHNELLFKFLVKYSIEDKQTRCQMVVAILIACYVTARPIAKMIMKALNLN